jgi:hypothetical protein
VTCSVVGCTNEATKTAVLGFGPESQALTVTAKCDVPLCDEHVDMTYRRPWNLTLDYEKLDLPSELQSLVPKP